METDTKTNFRKFREFEVAAKHAINLGRASVPWMGSKSKFDLLECLDCQGGNHPPMMQPLTALLVEHGVDLKALCDAVTREYGDGEAILVVPTDGNAIRTIRCGKGFSLFELMTIAGEMHFGLK